MRDFYQVQLFLKIVKLRGVSSAARALAIPRSTVSRQLAALERELGARLVQRSTRSFGLTEEGVLVHEQFLEIAQASATIQEQLGRKQPSGVLRVTAPFSLALNMLTPMLPAFLKSHPDLSVSLDLSARRADLIGEDFDVALRAGRVESTSLVGRRLGITPFVLVATAGYLAAAPPLTEPAHIPNHAVLAFHHTVETLRSWTFAQGDRQVTVQFMPKLTANDHAILLRAAIDGAGVTSLPARLCRDALRSGALVRCLLDWDLGDAEIYALYPSRRELSSKVRVFIDYLAGAIDFSD